MKRFKSKLSLLLMFSSLYSTADTVRLPCAWTPLSEDKLRSNLWDLTGCNLVAEDTKAWVSVSPTGFVTEYDSPDATHPLHVMHAEGKEIPFEFRYHSNGNRVSDDPCPWGYGWSLLPDIRISRRIIGRPDGFFRSIAECGKNYLTNNECFHAMTDSMLYMSANRQPDDYTDPAPDIYTIRLADASLTTVFRYGHAVTAERDEYRIEANELLTDITVTDPDGFVYHFDTQGECSYTPALHTELLPSRITCPSGKEITFTYKSCQAGSHMTQRATPHMELFVRNNPGSLEMVDAGYIPPDCRNVMHLASMEYNGEKVSLEYSTGARTHVAKMSVTESGRTVRTIGFTYDSAGTVPEKISTPEGDYSFSYNPRQLLQPAGRDWWGFSNGASYYGPPSVSLDLSAAVGLTQWSQWSYNTGQDRSVSEDYIKARMLVKAVYPTGGYTTWEYETHRFAPQSPKVSAAYFRNAPVLTTGGGVRVRSIKTYEKEGDTAPTEVSYIYGENGNGLAVCEAAPTIDTFLDTWDYIDYCKGESWEFFRSTCVLSVSPESNYMRYRFGQVPIWYSRVDEVSSEGKTSVTFEDIIDSSESYAPYSNLGEWPGALSYVFSDGPQMTSRTVYALEGGTYKKVLETVIKYTALTADVANGHHIRRHRRCSEQTFNQASPDFSGCDRLEFGDMIYLEKYPENAPDIPSVSGMPARFLAISEDFAYTNRPFTIYARRELPYSETTTEYRENGNRTVKTDYTYVSGTGLVSEVKVTSGDNTLVSTTTYPTSQSTDAVEREMADRNMSGTATGHAETYAGCTTTKEAYMVKAGKTFRPTSVYTTISGRQFYERSYAWNSDGNMISATDLAGVKTSYTWDTRGRHPVGMSLAGMGWTATWQPGCGPSSLTSPDGVKETYTYDSAGRLLAETDAELGGKWRIHVYDTAGRDVLQAECAITEEGILNIKEAQNAQPPQKGTGTWGYTTPYSLPSGASVCRADYYDGYGGFDAAQPMAGYGGATLLASPKGRLTGTRLRCDDGTDHTLTYRYDKFGRLAQTIDVSDSFTHTTATEYNYSGQPVKVTEKLRHMSGESWEERMFVTEHTYDKAGRLGSTTVKLDGKTVAYTERGYDGIGRPSSVAMKKSDGAAVWSGQEYLYDVHGWPTQLKTTLWSGGSAVASTSGLSSAYYPEAALTGGVAKAAAQGKSYTETVSYADGRSPRYDGVPSSRTLVNGGRYDYTFDSLCRLTGADYTPPQGKSGEDFSVEYTYDILSRPLSAKRMGVVDTDGTTETFGVLDDISLEYDGALPSVRRSDTGEVEGRSFYGRTGWTQGISMASSTMDFNSAGRMTKDTGRGLGTVQYNTLGLPTLMSSATTNHSSSPHKKRVYDAAGRLMSQTEVVKLPSGLGINFGLGINDERLFIGSFTLNHNALERVDFPGGYIDGLGKAHFLYRDWQGNVVLTVDGDNNVEQIVGYYPYGEPWREPSGQRQTLFAGKERQHGQLSGDWDFGPRHLSSPSMLWSAPDVNAADNPWWSPWAYCGGNPIANIDPDGKIIIFVNGYLGFGSPNGGEEYWNSRFIAGAKKTLKDNNIYFTNVKHRELSTARERFDKGYHYAEDKFGDYIKNIDKKESVKLVSHSMGGAFATGIEQYFSDHNIPVEYNIMLNTYQGNKIEKPEDSSTVYIDYSNIDDPVLNILDEHHSHRSVNNSDYKIREKTRDSNLFEKHRFPIDQGFYFWNLLKELLYIK